MKKIFFLIVLLCISGCYDYVELTDLSIITTITIDKKDDMYDISFEILNSQNKNDKSLIINGQGKNIDSAVKDVFQNTPKQPYLAHLKILAISESVAKDNLKEIMEYFLRSPNIRSEFYLVLNDGEEAKDIFEIQSDIIPVISDYLEKTINQNNNSSNTINIKNFENIIIDIFERGKDSTIPVIHKNNNTLRVATNGIMNNFKLVGILNNDDSIIYNILDGKTNNASFSFRCPDSNEKNFSLTIYDSDTKYKIKEDNLRIETNINAEIDEFECDLDLKKAQTIEDLNNYYGKEIQKKINDFYKIIKDNKTDILGIGKLLYNKKRFFKEDDWLRLNQEVSVNLKINKEGLIFGVKNGH